MFQPRSFLQVHLGKEKKNSKFLLANKNVLQQRLLNAVNGV